VTRRRILYLCTDRGVAVFGRKGASVHVQSIVRAMRAAGHEVTLAAVRWGDDVPADLRDVPRWVLPAAALGQGAERERAALAWDAALADVLRSGPRFDLIYERHALWSAAGMEFARDGGVPGVLEVNAPLIDEQRRYRGLVLVDEARAVSERACRAAARIVCVSDAVAGYVRSWGVDPEMVRVVPNGVDVTRFLVRETASASGDLVVGFVGTLKPWHGTETLIDALGLLRERGVAVRGVIVGDGPEAAALRSRAEAVGVADTVSFVGSVEPAAVPEYLAGFDVAVAPYPDLPGMYFSPLKVFEYLAAGVATVASDVGQIRDLLQGGQVLLVPPGDALALADALERLADAPASRAALGAAGRAWVEAEQTWDSVWARSVADLAGVAGG
jgi:glycosyltransferase involved in cell wall biosynthesis